MLDMVWKNYKVAGTIEMSCCSKPRVLLGCDPFRAYSGAIGRNMSDKYYRSSKCSEERACLSHPEENGSRPT
jgi:hypothetical protein